MSERLPLLIPYALATIPRRAERGDGVEAGADLDGRRGEAAGEEPLERRRVLVSPDGGCGDDSFVG